MNGSECDLHSETGQHLRELIQKTDALTVLLLTQDGRSVCAAGDTAQVNTTVLARLVAAMVSSGSEVARVVGGDRFSTVLQHGAHRHVHMSLLDDSYVLAIVFEDDRQTGLVRVQARRTAENLAKILPLQPFFEKDGESAGTKTLTKRRVDPIERIFGTQKHVESDPQSH
jgi:predicted regulator of Ras-like GTPase activity (Roadblock/LC7/MglB family)